MMPAPAAVPDRTLGIDSLFNFCLKPVQNGLGSLGCDVTGGELLIHERLGFSNDGVYQYLCADALGLGHFGQCLPRHECFTEFCGGQPQQLGHNA